MATTAKGYPYPLPSDPVAGGADAIKALAEMIDSRLGAAFSGIVTITGDGSTVNPGAAVTFPVGRFTSTPRVVSTVQAGAATHLAGVGSGITVSGATIFFIRRDGAIPANGVQAIVNYVAVQAG